MSSVLRYFAGVFALTIALLASAPEVAASVEPEPLRRLEVQVTPVSVQMNPLDRQHVGTLGRVTSRFHRLFSVYVGGGYNWFTEPQQVRPEFPYRLGDEPPRPTQMTWSTFIGVETIPISGELRIGSLISGRFGLSISAGAGAAGTRVQLKPQTLTSDGSTSTATWGFGNVRVAGHGAIAWRFEFGAFAASLGVRGTMWSDATTTVNGCNVTDLRTMDGLIRRGLPHTTAMVTAGCAMAEQNDIPLAMSVLRAPGELTVNLAGEFALSWSFF